VLTSDLLGSPHFPRRPPYERSRRNTLRHNLFRDLHVVHPADMDRPERLCQDDNENPELLESTNVSTFSEPGMEDHEAWVDGELAAGSPFGGGVAEHGVLRISARSERFRAVTLENLPTVAHRYSGEPQSRPGCSMRSP
jgi:hypothetical protein